MSEQDGKQATTVQRPANDDKEAWEAYWIAQGQEWRIEPEIDTERQQYLADRRRIIPDIYKGIYPFKNIKLRRADVEWLIIQSQGQAFDLCGADLRDVNLFGLPLDFVHCGIERNVGRGIDRTTEQCEMAAVHLEGATLMKTSLRRAALNYSHLERALLDKAHLEEANLTEAHLEGAFLQEAHLEKGFLYGVHLEGAHLDHAHLEDGHLYMAHLEQTELIETHFERANLYAAHLAGANLAGTYLDGADLREADLQGVRIVDTHLQGTKLSRSHLEGFNLRGLDLEGADLCEAHLEGADLSEAHLEGANLKGAHLEGANLEYAHLEGADLLGAHLEGVRCCRTFFDAATRLNDITINDEQHGSASIGDVSWNSVNLTVVDWSSMNMLGYECQAHQRKTSNGELKTSTRRLLEYKQAVRANRQLAVVLREQGLNEEADRFAYRAQLLQRKVWSLQRKPLKYLFSWFLYLLAGYGYRPIRSVIWYLIIIFGFAVAYFAFGHLPPVPDALVFSLTSFHGRGFFPGLGNETSLHNPLVVLAAIEAVVGLFIEISFIATFTQRFFGR